MALNPFEQLRNVCVEPRQAFEDAPTVSDNSARTCARERSLPANSRHKRHNVRAQRFITVSVIYFSKVNSLSIRLGAIWAMCQQIPKLCGFPAEALIAGAEIEPASCLARACGKS